MYPLAHVTCPSRRSAAADSPGARGERGGHPGDPQRGAQSTAGAPRARPPPPGEKPQVQDEKRGFGVKSPDGARPLARAHLQPCCHPHATPQQPLGGFFTPGGTPGGGRGGQLWRILLLPPLLQTLQPHTGTSSTSGCESQRRGGSGDGGSRVPGPTRAPAPTARLRSRMRSSPCRHPGAAPTAPAPQRKPPCTEPATRPHRAAEPRAKGRNATSPENGLGELSLFGGKKKNQKKNHYLVEKKAILGHITRATTRGASYTATQARRRDWVTQ